MASFGDRVFDQALAVLDTEANVIHLTTQEATTYTEATSTYTVGNSTSLSIGSPADRSGGGREVTVAAISDGNVTGNGTATHYALVDTSNSRLLATNDLSATQVVTSGNTWTLGSFAIGIPDPS